MNGPSHEADDIWGFTAYDHDFNTQLPDLRMSNAFIANEVAPGFSNSDMTGEAKLTMSMNFSAESSMQIEQNANQVPSRQQTVVDMFGIAPPPTKRKRRREPDILEATISYGTADSPPVISTSTATTYGVSSSSNGSDAIMKREHQHHHEPTATMDGEYIVYLDSPVEEQHVPVFPPGCTVTLCDEFASAQESIVQLRQHQYQCLKQDRSKVPQQKENIRNIIARIQAIEDAIISMKCECLLHPSDVHRLFWIEPQITIAKRQLDIYSNEINHFLNPGESWKQTDLVFEEHPFPISLKQKENVPQITVRLLTGACTNVTSVGPVEARVVSTSQGSSKPPEILNNVEKMVQTEYHPGSTQQGVPYENGYHCTFNYINFSTGTRMRDFNLQFSCKVNLGAGRSEYCETEPSPPFVVFTNGNQWNDIEGILLRWEAFSGSPTTQWCKLCNALQRRYIMATLQPADTPQRPLSRADFNFLYQAKIEPKSVPTSASLVNDKQFAELWSWLGEGIHRLHVNSKLLKCWTSGFILGFISRESAKSVLSDRMRGTFIVRFSESSPGKFAVSFATTEFSTFDVGNYLMGPEEARNLPDTVREYSNLTSVVRIIDQDMDHATYAATSKDLTFGTMYSKMSSGQNPVTGYMKTMVSSGR